MKNKFINKKFYFNNIMEQKSSRKYNSVFRKKLVNKFENIKNKEDLLDIFNIITEDIGDNFSSNRNGIFFNMNILSDKCIDNLMIFLEKINVIL